MDDRYVSDAGVAAWIGERLPDLDSDIIAAVLRVEHEYIVATGITTPEGWDDFDPRFYFLYRYYQPGELAFMEMRDVMETGIDTEEDS